MDKSPHWFWWIAGFSIWIQLIFVSGNIEGAKIALNRIANELEESNDDRD